MTPTAAVPGRQRCRGRMATASVLHVSLAAAAPGRPCCSYCWAPGTGVIVTSRSGLFRPPTLQLVRRVRAVAVDRLPAAAVPRPPTLKRPLQDDQVQALLLAAAVLGRSRCSTHGSPRVIALLTTRSGRSTAAHIAATSTQSGCPGSIRPRSGRTRPPTLQRLLDHRDNRAPADSQRPCRPPTLQRRCRVDGDRLRLASQRPLPAAHVAASPAARKTSQELRCQAATED